jgi:hypothetical protein
MIGNEVDLTSLMAGAAEYMAPELFPDNNTPVVFTIKSDVYGFAMLAYVVYP